MHPIRKTAVTLTAAALILTPVVASAAPAMDGVRAVSQSGGTSDLEGNSSWIIGAISLLAGIAAIIIIASNDDDAPVSP